MIFLLRHGETELNLQGRLQGRSQASLTEAGRSFAHDTARVISREVGEDDCVVFTSPLIRALETTEIIGSALSGLRKTVTDDRISELCFGKWDGLTNDEIDAGWPGDRDVGAPGEWYFNSPGGEGFDAFRLRLAHFLDDVTNDPQKHRIIVSHGLAGRVLRGIHADLSTPDTMSLPVPSQAFFILQTHGGIKEVAVE
ncbi:histidine phosphatase family protein [Yoonia sediminilitoris]|uniref:Putative phosphoglycerate mutase n=1 Tax=Yoonia sediminilitoris TaxID=1286148 RepID=A0A2T6KDP2_9RHOB|nr:histidine phosphatase family protein [Yoonia sediminilitoris]PUB13097.1 putative phosphoglycerate mutase [Yoonia sediminilitoris]RCW94434.1 putative phosphoglycerate mutase [Yoonia sediminilitoris]